MIYFTFIIPVVCGSFMIYLNNLSEACSAAFNKDEEPSSKGEGKIVSNLEIHEEPVVVLRRSLEESKISKIQLGHLTEYAAEKAKRVKQ